MTKIEEGFTAYPKMKTLFALENENGTSKKWSVTNGKLLAETAALHYLPLDAFVFTEKIDGTNMGIVIKNAKITIQKRNVFCNSDDKNDSYYYEILNHSMNKDIANCELENCIVYGELCGPKIQIGGNYFKERKFLVFDILDLNENKFYKWETVKYFAERIGFNTVPEITYTKNDLNVESVKDYVQNMKSTYNNDFNAEGFVVRYKNDTTTEKRWMAKIRRCDFK
jgi:ATP-dependent RNA circularization protein (DNA/RNA ligase family)